MRSRLKVRCFTVDAACRWEAMIFHCLIIDALGNIVYLLDIARVESIGFVSFRFQLCRQTLLCRSTI